jgi:DNA recombination protein RmuC
MASWVDGVQLLLLVVVVVLLLWLALRRDGGAAEALERNLRADVQDSARATRQELTATLATFQQSLLAQSGDVARTQNEQIDSFRTQLATMQQRVSDDTRAAREAQGWSRCAPRSTRSCTPRWNSAWAKASSRWPTGWSRCTRAWARCRPWRATWARSAAC